MFESFFVYLCSHAIYAHFVLFVCLLLAGINIPISEDVVLITGGVIVSICVPDHYLLMLGWLYTGCILSAYEAYWLGRLAGPQLYDMVLIRHMVTPGRVSRLKGFIERFGIFTFIVGRFIPGGMRNCLFMTSGLSGIPFPVFIFRDGIAALFSTTLLFQLGFLFGENYSVLFAYVNTYQHVVLGIIGVGIAIMITFFWYRNKKAGVL